MATDTTAPTLPSVSFGKTDPENPRTWGEDEFCDFLGGLGFYGDAAAALADGDPPAEIAANHRALWRTLAVLMLMGRVSREDVDAAARIVNGFS